ncbi:hypothetical protein HBI12_128910 [Parastagonospora nodorum]|nr:hypothetical protein HBI12_128910 [Parastagonospora nodorum]
MGIASEHHAYADDSATANADAGAVNEPLVLDLGAIYDGYDKVQSPPLTPPPSQKASQEQHDRWLSDDEQDSRVAPAPPDFTRRGIHIPSRTSSNTPSANKKRLSMQRRISADASSMIMPQTPEPQQYPVRVQSRTPSSQNNHNGQRPMTSLRNPEPTVIRSSADSVISYESSAPSIATQQLGPLQQKVLDDDDRLSPLLEDDPGSFDLVAPVGNEKKQASLEDESERLFSKQHLQAIFNDTPSLLRFTSFLSTTRPQSIPILIYYLDALKALRAINYANAVAEALEPIEKLEFTDTPARATVNAVLEEKANKAFDVLVRDDLPAFITHVFTQVASVSIAKRVTGNLPPMLREASEGLAEVFCLTDPSRTDNPIIFASEEFHRTTQYGVGYAIGRNCRFLQGPKTNKSSVARFKEMITSGREHSEVFLNYRRDGSPFMNLLMTAPLFDSRGTLRYFIGAQIDVSGLVKDGTELEAFQRMREQQQSGETHEEPKDEFQELSKMFNNTELDIVRKHGGNMHREVVQEQDDNSTIQSRPRVLIQDQSTFDHVETGQKSNPNADGKLSGPYKHYLLVRPAPSLRILFSSPSLRVPGILQSPFLDRIGGSTRVRASVGNALADGTRGVTAKIRWLSRAVPNLEESYEEGRPRWIHCTPLLGSSGSVGVWMVVLVDEDRHMAPSRRFRQAPPIASDVRNGRGGGGANRYDEYDDQEYGGGYVSRAASRGEMYGPGAVRHVAVDTLRQPQSPRSNASMHDQRAMRSPSASLRNYMNGGHNGSTDTFDI